MSMRNMLVFVSILLLISAALAAPPKVTLKSGQIPCSEGITNVWFSSGDHNTPVTLSFTPPWDFTTGPRQSHYSQKYIPASEAFNGSDFPDAHIAMAEVMGTERSFKFYKKVAKGMIWYGLSS